MARRKNQKVDEHFHRESGIRFEIYLTPENEFVTSEIMGQVFQGPDARKLVSDTYKYLDVEFKMDFRPAIGLSKVTPFHEQYWEQRSSVGLQVWRFKWARNPSGKLFTLHWDREENPTNAEPFIVGHRWSGVFAPPLTINGTTYLPYDEDTWAGCLALVATIEQARLRVEELMSVPDMTAALLAKTGKSTPLLEAE